MNHNLGFDFSVNKENNTITVQREFAAEKALVWAAYTQSELLDQWWAPKPWKSRTKSMDFREGGHWHYAMVGPEGEEHWGWTDYENIRTEQAFDARDAFTDAAGNINRELPQSKWEVKFEAQGEETTKVNIHIVYPDLAQLESTIQMGFKEGLAMGMENLDALLSTLKNQ